MPVLVDGGIRRGTDVLKALAFGADAVLIGKPYLYGLGAAGESGVTNVINILQREFQMAMVLTGRANIGSIDRSVIWAWAAVLMGSTVAALPISSRVATRENCESPAG